MGVLEPYIVSKWQTMGIVFGLLLAIFSSSHAVIYKRDSRSAVLWVAFIWILPIAGSILYALFGINRVKRRALLLRGNMEYVTSEPMAGQGDLHHSSACFGSPFE